MPVHVTLRVADQVWNLRTERSFAVIHGALADGQRRPGFRVAHFSIQGDHLHLIAEADGAAALARGIRALGVRLARRLNRMMGRQGRVLADRYHAHVLRTPAEVRNALRYVADNHRNHLTRLGFPVASGPDPYSSAAARSSLRGQLALWPEAATRAPRSWLLRTARRDCLPPGPGQAQASRVI